MITIRFLLFGIWLLIVMDSSEAKTPPVTVPDYLEFVYHVMTRKSSRMKAVFLRLSDDKREIVVDEANQFTLEDAVGPPFQDPYENFIHILDPRERLYAIYSAAFETKETKKEELVFIYWAPDTAPIREKILYDSTKDAVLKKFPGIKHRWEVNTLEDIKDRRALAEMLGGQSVVSLEGIPV